MPFAHQSKAHWVIAELDARGEIDRHATMCIDFTIDVALDDGAATIVIDLRDLAAIDAPGLALFARARARCLAGGAHLRLLISGHASHVAIARAFASAGFVAQLEFTEEDPASVPVAPRLVRVS